MGRELAQPVRQRRIHRVGRILLHPVRGVRQSHQREIADQRAIAFGVGDIDGDVLFTPDHQRRRGDDAHRLFEDIGEIGAVVVDHGGQCAGLLRIAAVMRDDVGREIRLVNGAVGEGLADAVRPARTEQQLGEPGDLEKGDVPAFALLRPERLQRVAEHRRVGDVHDDQAIERPGVAQREDPGDQRPPVMRDQQAASCAQGVEDRGGVGDEMIDVIIALPLRPAAAAIAAQIGRDGVPAVRGEQRQLVPPGFAAFGKAVEAQRDVGALATFIDGKGQAVGLDRP
ncbi:MAG: hypothetical protein RL490_2536 [Pseudomonadota bacterium]